MARAKIFVENKLTGAFQGTLLSDEDCLTLDSIIQLGGDKGVVPDLKHKIYALDNSTVSNIIQAKSNKFLDDEDKPLGELTDLQTVGTAFMYFAKRCILGDSVGMGKTAQVMGLHTHLTNEYAANGKDFRTIVFTEKATTEQFRREAVKFTSDYFALIDSVPSLDNFLDSHGITDHISLLEKGDPVALSTPFILPNMVVGHSVGKSAKFQEVIELFNRFNGRPSFDMVVVDESGTVLGNNKSDIYKALKGISSKSDYVILLNATSFESALSKFYCQLDFADPTFLPTKTAFNNRYCKTRFMSSGSYRQIIPGQYKNQHEFRDKVRYRYFARTRKEHGSRLEGCTSNLILMDKSPLQTKQLQYTSLPEMVYDNPSSFDKTIKFHEQNPKVNAVYALLKGKLDNTIEGNWGTARTVLVYCKYIEAMSGLRNILVSKGIPTEIMNGSTKKEERSRIVEGFKTGKFRVLITNVMKGLNFGNTDHILIYSIPGNVNQMVQFEGRATREFDIINKHLVVLCTKGQEMTRLSKVLSYRAKNSELFSGSDNSLILSLFDDLYHKHLEGKV